MKLGYTPKDAVKWFYPNNLRAYQNPEQLEIPINKPKKSRQTLQDGAPQLKVGL